MDGGPNSRNNAALSDFSGVLRKGSFLFTMSPSCKYLLLTEFSIVHVSYGQCYLPFRFYSPSARRAGRVAGDE